MPPPTSWKRRMGVIILPMSTPMPMIPTHTHTPLSYFFVYALNRLMVIITWCGLSLSWSDSYLPISPHFSSLSLSIFVYISIYPQNISLSWLPISWKSSRHFHNENIGEWGIFLVVSMDENNQIGKTLGGIHHRVARRMANMHPGRTREGRQIYQPLDMVMMSEGMEEVET